MQEYKFIFCISMQKEVHILKNSELCIWHFLKSQLKCTHTHKHTHCICLSCLKLFKQAQLTRQSTPEAHEKSLRTPSLISGTHLGQPFSKCGLISIISVTRELVRNAHSQAPRRPTEAEMLEVEPLALQVRPIPLKFESH